MRGHWLSQTRKLNRHYQSGAVAKVLDASGLIIENIALNMTDIGLCFAWHTLDSGARKCLLTLCRRASIPSANVKTGEVVTTGVSASFPRSHEMYTYKAGTPAEEKDWLPVAVIPHFSVAINVHGEDGRQKIFINTRDLSIFEKETDEVKLREEELTFTNDSNNRCYYRVQTSTGSSPYTETDQPLSGPMTRKCMVLYIKKSKMTYTARTYTYSITAAKVKEYFDKFYFDIEWNKMKVVDIWIDYQQESFSFPFSNNVGAGHTVTSGIEYIPPSGTSNGRYVNLYRKTIDTNIGYTFPDVPNDYSGKKMYPVYKYYVVTSTVQLVVKYDAYNYSTRDFEDRYTLLEMSLSSGVGEQITTHSVNGLEFKDLNKPDLRSINTIGVQWVKGGYVKVESEFGWVAEKVTTSIAIGCTNFWNNTSRLRELPMFYWVEVNRLIDTAMFIGGYGGFESVTQKA